MSGSNVLPPLNTIYGEFSHPDLIFLSQLSERNMNLPSAKPISLSASIIKIMALVIPWGIIEVAVRKHEIIGYMIGLSVGLLCFYAMPPRSVPFWRVAVLGIVIATLYIVWYLFLR